MKLKEAANGSKNEGESLPRGIYYDCSKRLFYVSYYGSVFHIMVLLVLLVYIDTTLVESS